MAGLINYVKKVFKNYPDTTTPINAENLNHLDNAIYDLDQAVNTQVTQINASLTSAVTNINNNKEYKPSYRVINAQKDLLKVVLGDNDHIINQPYYFSTDAATLTNLPTGAPSDSFYGWREVKCVMSLTTVILHEMHPVYGRMWVNTYDTNVSNWLGWKTIGGNMRPNFSKLLKNFANGTTVTIDQDSFLVGSIGDYEIVTINGTEIVRTGGGDVDICVPVKSGDKILINNYAQSGGRIALHVFGVLN